MLATLMTEPSKRRRSRNSRETQSITFRITPEVKKAIRHTAKLAARSENLQLEVFVKIGFLQSQGFNLYGMTEIQIVEQFNKVIGVIEEESTDD